MTAAPSALSSIRHIGPPPGWSPASPDERSEGEAVGAVRAETAGAPLADEIDRDGSRALERSGVQTNHFAGTRDPNSRFANA